MPVWLLGRHWMPKIALCPFCMRTVSRKTLIIWAGCYLQTLPSIGWAEWKEVEQLVTVAKKNVHIYQSIFYSQLNSFIQMYQNTFYCWSQLVWKTFTFIGKLLFSKHTCALNRIIWWIIGIRDACSTVDIFNGSSWVLDATWVLVYLKSWLEFLALEKSESYIF